MQKTKFGISATFMVALTYFLGLYGGYVITGVLVGYILLAEEDLRLKKQALGVLVLMLVFSLVSTVLALTPNILSLLTDLLELVNVHYYFSFFHRVYDFFASVLSLLKTALFVVLGVLAVFGKDVKLPVIGKIIDKYMA